jgi:hypothetical protein
MKPGEITRGDVLRMTDLRRGVVLDVTVLDVKGDKAIVIDRKRPGMRLQVGVEFLSPREQDFADA